MRMEYTPDIDMIIALNVEDDVGMAPQDAAAEPGKAKLVGIPRRSGGRMVPYEAVRRLQCIDETGGNVGPGFTSVIVNRRLDVSSCRLAWPDGLLAHLRLAWRTRFLRPLK